MLMLGHKKDNVYLNLLVVVLMCASPALALEIAKKNASLMNVASRGLEA